MRISRTLKQSKKYLLNSENSSVISTSPPALCTKTSSPENSSAYKCNSLSLEFTKDKEILDILEELQNREPCIMKQESPAQRMNGYKGIFVQTLSLI